MDEQRLEVYFNLIQKLLQCSDGQEEEILQTNLELVNGELVQTMEAVAAQMAEVGNGNTANWLRNLAGELGKRLGISSTVVSSEEYRKFLISILEAVATDDSPQSVYPLLQENLDKLDENLGQILQSWAKKTLPQVKLEEAEYCARFIGEFGNLILDFPLGDRTSNLEIAIVAYEIFATVFTSDKFPQQWAMAQNNLGLAYSYRIKGERADNLEQSIAAYSNALQIYTKSAFPQDWATTKNNLGIAYSYRIKGERANNLELAIAAFTHALQIYTKSAFPQQWAATQNNLGIAYWYRIKVERADNIELAIAAFTHALQIFTKSAFPQQWAITQNNLGIAYSYRIKGERADNIELAIAAFTHALPIRTKSAFPQDWTSIQNNLGIAYSNRIKGDRAENFELAIAAYSNSLQIRTKSAFPQDWATTKNNLGTAYRDRIKGERVDNLELAIAAYSNALQILTPENFPIECLGTARSLGNLALENNNWQLAIQSYALAIQAVEQSRSWAIDEERRQEIIADSIDVYNKIVQACLNLGEIKKAVEYTERSRAQRLVDMMASNELYQGGDIAPEVEQHLQEYEELQQRINVLRFGTVPVLAGSSHEKMSLGMGVKQSHQSLTKDALLVYEEEIQKLEAQKQQVWQQLRRYDPVLAGQVQVEHLHWEQMQELIEETTTALLSFYTTNEDTYIFVLLKDRSPQVFTCEGQGQKALQTWIGHNWLIPYIESKDKWKEKMGDFLQELAERLQLEKLVEKYLNGIEELIIVPHRFLHQIPFAALPMKAEGRGQKAEGKEEDKAGGRRQEAGGKEEDKAEKEERIAIDQTRGLAFNSKSSKSSPNKHVTKTTYLGDRFRIRLIPSCQILHYCHQRPPIEGQQMGIVEDATEDLPFTNFECETLAQIYQVPPEQRLQGRKATVKSYQKLAQQVQILHSSHHAKSNPTQPLESQLSLGDGSLTLGQLLTPSWRMPNLSEVFACACEVNFTITKVTDDLLTLATGFLCAGARSVVSTQWSVEDLASALLAIFYYKNREARMSRSQALQQGQIKLRKLTGEDFTQNYQAQLNSHLQQKLEEVNTAKQQAQAEGDQAASDKWLTIAKKLEGQQQSLQSLGKKDFPFAHPFYWAGFVAHGMACSWTSVQKEAIT